MSKIGSDYEQMGADAAAYMLAPVRLGPQLEGKVTALGAGTRNPTGAGIPLHAGRGDVDYITDESSLRSLPSRKFPLSVAEADEYADYTPEDDREQILDALRRDREAMTDPAFRPEIGVVPVKEISAADKGTAIRVSDFSSADSFRPMKADRYKPGIRFVHFSDAPVYSPYAKSNPAAE